MRLVPAMPSACCWRTASLSHMRTWRTMSLGSPPGVVWKRTPIHPWDSLVPLKFRVATVSAMAKNVVWSPRCAARRSRRSLYSRSSMSARRSERLALMLDREYKLLLERLAAQRGDHTTFFAIADTVATRNFKGTNESHGWMGVRFQTTPGGEPSDIVLHVRMWDKDAVLQQQALGIAGTNLIYGAFYYRSDPGKLIESLLDNLGSERL